MKSMVVEQACSRCGHEFIVQYNEDGTYGYLSQVCDCEAEFYPLDGLPSITEWLESVR